MDLVAFLRAGRRLEYGPANCEARFVTLLTAKSLKVALSRWAVGAPRSRKATRTSARWTATWYRQ